MSGSNSKTQIYAVTITGFFAILTTLLTVFQDEIKSLFSNEVEITKASNSLIYNIKASSTLKPQDYNGKTNSYVANNAIDKNLSTAWVEGVSGEGIGEYLRIEFSKKVEIQSIDIVNGYAKSSKLYKENNQLKNILISTTDFDQEFSLKSTIDYQRILFERPLTTDWLRIQIRTVFRGSKYDDTAITEIVFNKTK